MDISKLKKLYKESVYDDLFEVYKTFFWRFRVEGTKYTPTLYSQYLILTMMLYVYMVTSWTFTTIELIKIWILLILQAHILFIALCIIIPKVVSSIKLTSFFILISYIFELARHDWIYTNYKFEKINIISIWIIIWSISFHYCSWKDFDLKKVKTADLVALLIESAWLWIVPYILIIQILS